MPEDNDIIKSTLVHTISGVAVRNDIYWQIVNLGTVTTLTEVADILMLAWRAASINVLSDQVEYTGVAVENITRNEVRGVVTSTVTGSSTSGSHPQDQVVRFNEYGQDGTQDPIRRGAINVSGVGEVFSSDGRINDVSEFSAIETFLGTQLLDVSTGLTMNPQVRRQIPGSSPPAFTYHRTIRALMNPTLFKLKSRTVQLLGI